MKKNLLALSITGLLALSLTACNSNSSNANIAPASKTTLVINAGAPVPTLDPSMVQDVTSQRIDNDLFEGLTSLDQSNKPVPGVAKSWDISADGLVYTFHLRDDAKWSNGKTVTAADFVYGMRRTIDPKTASPSGYYLDVIKNGKAITKGKEKPDTLGVKAIDAHTLQITLAHPAAYFLSLMSTSNAYPLYKQAVEKNPKGWWASPKTIVSNGAYMLKEWVPNGHLLEVKNPHYWDAKNVRIAKVKFLPISNFSSAHRAYTAGRIDFTLTMPLGATAAQYRKMYGSQFYDVSQLSVYYYDLNVNNPELKNVDVRKALTLAVDRKAIVKNVARMGQIPLYSVLAIGLEGGKFDHLHYKWASESMQKRITQAKALLAKAGYGPGQKTLKLSITYNNSDLHKAVAAAVAEMWRKAFGSSVEVKSINQEWKIFLQTRNKQNYQIARSGWTADYNSASDFLAYYQCGNTNNATGYCSHKLDSEYNKAMHSTAAGYFTHMGNAIKIANDSYSTLPIMNYTYFRLVKPYVGGYHPKNNHLDLVYSKWLYFKRK